MNKEQIRKSIGFHVRLRPPVVTIQGEVKDDDWKLTRAEDRYILLERVVGGDILKVAYDQCHGFTSDVQRDTEEIQYGFLALHGWLTIKGSKIEFEPAPSPRVANVQKMTRSTDRVEKENGNATEEAWSKLRDALDAAQVVYTSVKQVPDLDRLPEGELVDMLNRTFLSPVQREGIRGAQKKTELFMDYVSWHEAAVAADRIFMAKEYVERQLSIPQRQKEKFLACSKFLLDAVNDYKSWKEISKIRPEPSIRREGRQALDNALKLANELERELRPPT